MTPKQGEVIRVAGKLETEMNLSQIIAKDSHYDRRIPVEGHYDVLVKIQNYAGSGGVFFIWSGDAQ